MKALLKELTSLVRSTGGFIRKEAKGFDRSKVDEKKGFSDLVSYVDKEAEKRIVDHLGQLDKSIGFIAEEGTGERKKGMNWIIDPLDGTTNFIHGLPVFSVSIALADEEDLQAGVVYDVMQDDCFYAEKGQGSFCDGTRLKVSGADDLKNTLIATGFPYYEFSGLDEYLKILKGFMESTRGVRRMGSAAIDLAYTSAGKFDAFFEFNLNSYDVAAGAILVQEAGGEVSNFAGGDSFLFEREIAAAAPGVRDEVLAMIQDHWG